MQRTKRVISVSISMPPGLARRVRVQAAREDKSRSQFVCEVLERELSSSDVHAQQRRTEAEEVCHGD